MKHICLNLKRFDISLQHGGVNRLAPMDQWAKTIVEATEEPLRAYSPEEVEFIDYLPEAHLIPANAARGENSPLQLGCQGVHRADTAAGGNFGAFTSGRPANAAAELHCSSALIGHCEERADKTGILAEAGVENTAAVNRILNQEVLAAQKAGLRVLYCVGENEHQVGFWQDVLKEQLTVGLRNADLSRVVIAYEPIWSIGPGKEPAGPERIAAVADFIKQVTGGVDVIYGGGLKQDNAAMLASLPQIDGGLIALTRFQGKIGFYPSEYLEIIRTYLGK